MSEPMWLGGDPASYSSSSDGVQELDCDCGHTMEVGTSEEYSHGTVTWLAEWKCPNCGQSNSAEGWYDPNERD